MNPAEVPAPVVDLVQIAAVWCISAMSGAARRSTLVAIARAPTAPIRAVRRHPAAIRCHHRCPWRPAEAVRRVPAFAVPRRRSG